MSAWARLPVPRRRQTAVSEHKYKREAATREQRAHVQQVYAAQKPPYQHDTLVVYVDGSHDKHTKGTGYGVVVVEGGDGDEDLYARPVVRIWRQGRTGGTNNTAEIQAGICALKWLSREGSTRPVILRLSLIHI